MSLKVIDNKLLKKYTKIWKRISRLMNIKFGSEPVYGDSDQYIKTKYCHMEIHMESHMINANFQGKKVPKEIDSVVKVTKKCYPQTHLEECKYEIKKTKMENLINDDLDPSSSDNENDIETDSDSDNEPENDESDNEAT